jgi:chromate transport protein ChrA
MRLSLIAMALAAVQVAVGIGVSFFGTDGGWFGGVVYAVLYALPLLLIALALRSSRSSFHTAAGWAALVLAVYYCFIVVASWSSGFSRDDVFMVCTTAPTVALDLVIFWAAVLHRWGRPTTSRLAS